MQETNDVIKSIQLTTNVSDMLQQEKEQPQQKQQLQQAIPDNLSKILKGQISEQDFTKTVALKKQIIKFNEYADMIIESLKYIQQDPMANLKILIYRLLCCAEQTIVGKQQGKYRQQIVFDTVCKYLKSYGKDIDQDKQIMILWLTEEIFAGNRKNLSKNPLE